MTAAKLMAMPAAMRKNILAKMSPEDRKKIEEEIKNMDKSELSTETETEAAAADAELAATGPAEFTIPADLTTLEPGALGELAAMLEARGAELASKPALDDDELVEAESLAVVADEFAAEAARRAELAVERSTRAETALARFKVADTSAGAELATVLDEPAEKAPADAKAKADKTEATGELAVDAEKTDAEKAEGEPAAGGEEQETVTASADEPKRPTNFKGASPAFLRSKTRNVADPADRPPEGLGRGLPESFCLQKFAISPPPIAARFVALRVAVARAFASIAVSVLGVVAVLWLAVDAVPAFPLTVGSPSCEAFGEGEPAGWAAVGGGGVGCGYDPACCHLVCAAVVGCLAVGHQSSSSTHAVVSRYCRSAHLSMPTISQSCMSVLRMTADMRPSSSR